MAQEEDKTLTFYEFAQTLHRSLKTTLRSNVSNVNVRQRPDQSEVFTTEMRCLPIVWATIEGLRRRKVPLEETECQQGAAYKSL